MHALCTASEAPERLWSRPHPIECLLQAAQAEQEAKKAAEKETAEKAKAAGKKAGAWGGLPGR